MIPICEQCGQPIIDPNEPWAFGEDVMNIDIDYERDGSDEA